MCIRPDIKFSCISLNVPNLEIFLTTVRNITEIHGIESNCVAMGHSWGSFLGLQNNFFFENITPVAIIGFLAVGQHVVSRYHDPGHFHREGDWCTVENPDILPCIFFGSIVFFEETCIFHITTIVSFSRCCFRPRLFRIGKRRHGRISSVPVPARLLGTSL